MAEGTKTIPGSSMRVSATVICLFAILVAGLAQEKPPVQQPVASPVGLPVGAKAPRIALRDQFGRTQTNETLKGTKGTILLFFRSADW